jgi:acyl-CoA reductase-like NAD-dependent aldehyde dehydrogenase
MTVAFVRLEKLFINGAYVEASGGREDVLNPATGEVIAAAPVAGPAEIDAALAAARHAFDTGPWRKMSGKQRGVVLRRFHDSLLARVEILAEIVRLEAGAILADARPRQIELGLKHLLITIDLAEQDLTRVLPPVITPVGGMKALGTSVIVREPIGVVAAITAYNYPFLLALVKVSLALMTGNTVVLKTSPYTPFTALMMGEAAQEAGIPDGVLNILNGGADLGEALTTDPRVDCVTFTGSDGVGAKIAAQAAPTLKRVLLELGGKCPIIVRPDADRQLALTAMLRSLISHCGQGCGLYTRLLIHNSIRKEMVAELAERVRAVRIGDTADEATQLGPLIREAARSRIERYVEAARDGAKLVTGGKRPGHMPRGFYFEPTLFDDVDNKSPLAQDELFGPVSVVIGFDSDEEAIALSNDSPYGLRAAIMSADAGLAYEMSRELRVGHALINGGAMAPIASSYMPYGGVRRSGYGREGGVEGLYDFTDAKAIEFHAG